MGSLYENVFCSSMEARLVDMGYPGWMSKSAAKLPKVPKAKPSSFSLKGTWDSLLGILGTTSGAIGKTLKATPGVVLGTAGAGVLAGALGATAAKIISHAVTKEDPKVKLNNKMTAMYENKRREHEDAEWMSKVRSMRDDLKRGYKNMSVDEYTQRYNALMDALDERMA